MLQLINNIDIIDLEKATFDKGTSEAELMSRASSAFLSWFTDIQPATCNVDVICGKGNNGADGFLIAKGLNDRGYRVRILLIGHVKRLGANKLHLNMIKDRTAINILHITTAADLLSVKSTTVLIDAILGHGINRPVTGALSQIITACNLSYETIYGVDTPSGLGDYSGEVLVAMKCTASLAFEFPKVSFFNSAAAEYTGEWSYTSIGLDKSNLHNYSSKTHLILEEDLRKVLSPRNFATHKGKLGRVLHVLGHSEMRGAGILAAQASISAGAGVTYGYSLDKTSQACIPEIAWITSIADEHFMSKIDVIAIGSGLGTTDVSIACLDKVLELRHIHLVLDADALNIISTKEWLDRIPKGAILTPHIGEFNRLFPGCKSHHDRIEKQRRYSQEKEVTIILKGPYTSTSDKDGNIYYNKTGNPSLAKGGSGDVLTGIVAALRADPDLTPHQAGYIGSYLHGLAADLYVDKHHERSLTPLRLIDYIDTALVKITR